MKTVKRGNEVKRVADKAATKLVMEHNYQYCPKSVYRERLAGTTPIEDASKKAPRKRKSKKKETVDV